MVTRAHVKLAPFWRMAVGKGEGLGEGRVPTGWLPKKPTPANYFYEKI
jgi:hypothetical protein